jgi:hypothetical protein
MIIGEPEGVIFQAARCSYIPPPGQPADYASHAVRADCVRLRFDKQSLTWPVISEARKPAPARSDNSTQDERYGTRPLRISGPRGQALPNTAFSDRSNSLQGIRYPPLARKRIDRHVAIWQRQMERVIGKLRSAASREVSRRDSCMHRSKIELYSITSLVSLAVGLPDLAKAALTASAREGMLLGEIERPHSMRPGPTHGTREPC